MFNVLDIVAAAFCLYLFVVIRRIPAKGSEHRILSFAAIALFEFTVVAYAVYHTERVAVATVLIPVATVGAFAFIPLQLHFAYALLRGRPLSVAGMVALYVPALLFMVLNFIHPFSLIPEMTPDGLKLTSAAGTPVNAAWFGYVAITWLTAVWLYMSHWRSAKSQRERRQRTVLATAAAVFLVVVVTEFYLPLLVPDWSIPSQAPTLLSLWMGVMVYGLWRYGLLRISPRLLAEQILHSIEDVVLLYDMSGNRAFANRKATALLGPSSSLGGSRTDAFKEPVDRLLAYASEWQADEPERQFQTAVRGPSDRPLVLRARVKPAFDRFGDPLGVVVSATVIPDTGAAVDRFGLTDRENDVLQFLASGYSIGRTAAALSIGTRTVKAHITHIYQKTGARNRVELLNMLDDAPLTQPTAHEPGTARTPDQRSQS